MVIGLIFIAVVSTATFSFLSMSESTQSMVDAQSEKQQLKRWQIALTNAMVPSQISGTMMVPVGKNIDIGSNGSTALQVHGLPDGMGLPQSNTYGKYYIYCPIGSTKTNEGGMDTGEIYDVNGSYIANTNQFQGKNYVVSSEIDLEPSTTDHDIAYFIISPHRGDVKLPSCSAVQFDVEHGRFIVENGLVLAGTQTSILNETGFLTKIEDTTNYESNDLLDFVGSWKTATTLQYTLSLPSESFIASSDIDFCLPYDTFRRKVVIKGEYSENGVTTIDGNGHSLKFCNVDVTLMDVSFSETAIEVASSSLTLTNSVLNSVSVIDSELFASETVVFDSKDDHSIVLNNSDVFFNDGDFSFYSNSASHGQIRAYGSKVFFNDATVSLSESISGQGHHTNIYVDSLSELGLKDTIITSEIRSEQLIDTYGEISLNNSRIDSNESFVDAIKLNYGSSLTMHSSSSIEVNSGIGVRDIGASGIYGDNSRVVGSQCWDGLMFENTQSNTFGSSASQNNKVQLNRSDWTCNP